MNIEITNIYGRSNYFELEKDIRELKRNYCAPNAQ